MIKRGEAFLGRGLLKSASVPAVYQRKGRSAIDLPVAFGRRAMQVRAQDNSLLIANVRTAIIRLADLQGIEPEPGDRIISGGERWVVGFAGLDASWEFIGITKGMIRIYLRIDDAEYAAG